MNRVWESSLKLMAGMFACIITGTALAADLAADDFAVPTGMTYKTVHVSNVQTIKRDLTVPSNIVLKFENSGVLNLVEGTTVQINGSIDAPMQRVFTGAGKVMLGPGRIKEVYPQWWGAKGDGKADDTSAIQAAIDSVGRGVVFFCPGSYLTRTITTKSNIAFRGGGQGSTVLVYGPSTGSCIVLPVDCTYFSLEDMGMVSPANTDGYAIDGTNEYVRYFSMRNFSVSGFRKGVYIQQGMQISLDYGYLSGPGPGVPGSVCLQFGNKATNKGCTTATIKDLYITNAETDFYNRAAPCTMIRPIFETSQIGLDSYTRATIINPFFAANKVAAARLTDNGVYFIGPYPTEHTIVYSDNSARARTSFMPDTFDSPMKLGPMEMSPAGEISIGSKRLNENPQGGGK